MGALFSGALFSGALFSGALFSGALFSGALFSNEALSSKKDFTPSPTLPVTAEKDWIVTASRQKITP